MSPLIVTDAYISSILAFELIVFPFFSS
uniref:Uncharacterized protein n=1 Tax=Rhizophora mucronata TaxID=61149 RepID=A0A2P2PUH0_RHIMU